MLGTFYKSYTGLMANSLGLDVTGNNLANINTIGFKKSDARFAQIMTNVASTSGNGNPMQFGLGAKNTEIRARFTPGSFNTTGINTNVALEGEGFFQVNNNGRTNFTRAGNFSFNLDGELVAPNGGVVQGYLPGTVGGDINLGGGLADIKVDFTQASPPNATQNVRFITNVPATAEPGESFKSVVDVFDSNGESHVLQLNFESTDDPSVWNYSFEFANGTVSNGSGTMTFDETGRLTQFDGQPVNNANFTDKLISISGVEGAEDLAINWNVFRPGATPEDNIGYFTNFASGFSSGTIVQDGYSSGTLQNVDIQRDGTVMGFYTNGSIFELARIGVASFSNNHGLKQLDSGFYQATGSSGDPNYLINDETQILSGAVESSNVDIAEAFTDLIKYQRGYQASSKSITTHDQVLQEVLGLKR